MEMAKHHEFASEREILYTLFFDMKKDVTELKRLFFEVLQNPAVTPTRIRICAEVKELQLAETSAPVLYSPAVPSRSRWSCTMPFTNMKKWTRA
jgi:hypothetical protein